MEEIKHLINQWEEAVDSVDKEIMFEEYVAALDEREILAHLLKNIDNKDHKELEHVNTLDKIFIEKTLESDKNVWGSINEKRHNWNRKDNWYYYRLPKQGFLKDEDII